MSKETKNNEASYGTVFIPAQKRNGDSKTNFDEILENSIYTNMKSNGGTVMVKARGNAIGRAVNLVARIENRGFCKIKQDLTQIFSEKMDDGKFCSAINIVVEEN